MAKMDYNMLVPGVKGLIGKRFVWWGLGECGEIGKGNQRRRGEFLVHEY
jgi:hypothetical protein